MNKNANKNDEVKRYLLLALFVFFVSNTTFSQDSDLLDKKLTLTEGEISVIECLSKIEEKSKVYFSYSPDFFEEKVVQVNFDNRTLKQILDQLLKPEYAYNVNGEEIIIYQSKESEKKKLEEQAITDQERPEKETVTDTIRGSTIDDGAYKLRTDTVFVTKYDTITKADTIIVRDTITITDTVYIQRTARKSSKSTNLFRNTTLSDIRNKKNYTELYAGLHFGNFNFNTENLPLENLYKNAYSNMTSFEAGVKAGRHFNAFLLEAGLALRHIREGFDYYYSRPPETYYDTDTLDSYYTIEDQDTSWYYVTDSSLNTIPGKEERFQNQNHYTYLEVPLSAGYKFAVKDLIMNLKIGVVNSFLIDKGGYFINDDENNSVGEYSDVEMNLYSLSGSFSAGLVYYLDNFTALTADLKYRRAFSPQFENALPVSRNYSSLTGSVGFRFLF